MLPLLHLRLVHVPVRDADAGAGLLLDVAEDLPVAGVIGLDQLEAPLIIRDVPPDQGFLDVRNTS